MSWGALLLAAGLSRAMLLPDGQEELKPALSFLKSPDVVEADLRGKFEQVLLKGRPAVESLTYPERKKLAEAARRGLRKVRSWDERDQLRWQLRDALWKEEHIGQISEKQAGELRSLGTQSVELALKQSEELLEKALALLEDKPSTWTIPARAGGAKFQTLPGRFEGNESPVFWDGSAAAAARLDGAVMGAQAGLSGDPLKPSAPYGLGRVAPNLYLDGKPLPPAPGTRKEEEDKGPLVEIFESVYDPAEGQNTKWKHVPVKIIAFPAAKLMYDVPNTVSSLVVESVNRSPVHNAQGTADTAAGAGKELVGGVGNVLKGVLNPTNGALVDGALQIGDAALSVAKTGVGAAKTVLSVAGYPIYLLLGGEPSKRAPLPGEGKRAAIVLIDTGAPGVLGDFSDAFADGITRYHLSRAADFYCAAGPALGSLHDCVSKIPDDVPNVDLIHMGHGNQTRWLEDIAEGLARKDKKPGLVISVGCTARPSSLANPEDTVGQDGTSWAGHFYLSSLVEKRLRGIPMGQAAEEAYYENIPINYINPVSLSAIIAVGVMERGKNPADVLVKGYAGSKPKLAQP